MATGGAGGNVSSGGSGGSAGAPTRACVPEEDPPPQVEWTCEDLVVLTVSDPVVVDESGDGSVSPGENVVIQTKLNEVAGIGFSMYPGVYFESDNPEVTVNYVDWYYAIAGCQTLDANATASFGASLAPGTMVTITARVGMLNTDCPDAYAIEIPIQIQ
jgi:hypothetical protein